MVEAVERASGRRGRRRERGADGRTAILLGLIDMLPQGPLRWVVAASVGILVFAVPTIPRITPQPKLRADGRAAGGEALAGKGRAGLIAVVGACAAAIMTPLVAGWEGKRNDPYLDIVAVQTVCYGKTRADAPL
jgi:hypothetical protein